MISDNFRAWWKDQGEAQVMGFVYEQEGPHMAAGGTPSLTAESLRALSAFCYDSALFAVFHGQIGPRDVGKYIGFPEPTFERSKPFDPPTGALPVGDRS